MSMHPSEPGPEKRSPIAPVVIGYALSDFSERWILPEEPVPESAWHDASVELVRALLVAWIARAGRPAAVYRNLAVRVRADRPNVGFDPDVCLVEPAPPEGQELDSLLLYRSEHAAPRLVVEVVSPNHPYKDYRETPEKCALAGVRELVVFDPKLAGPRATGGPHLLQLWRREPDGGFLRTQAGDTAAFSDLLGAWWQPIDGARRLGISEDPGGLRPWLTLEQSERAAKDAERAAKDAERAAKDAERAAKDAERMEKEQALRRVAELEAELERARKREPEEHNS
jgi:Uma2 family endonuclease